MSNKTKVEIFGDVILATGYWNCECGSEYIKRNDIDDCHKCGAVFGTQPPSRANEVMAMLEKELAEYRAKETAVSEQNAIAGSLGSKGKGKGGGRKVARLGICPECGHGFSYAQLDISIMTTSGRAHFGCVRRVSKK